MQRLKVYEEKITMTLDKAKKNYIYDTKSTPPERKN